MANNELDAAFESEFGPVPKMDPLSEEVTQMKQETLSRLKVSINAASSMNPDQRADIMKIAKDRKIPVGVVERGYDHFAKEKKAQAVDVNRIVDEAPGLAEWLANPNNAAIAQDDLEAINDLRETVKDRGELEKMYNTLGYGFASLNSRIAKVPALIADTYYQYGVNPLAKALGYAEAKPFEGLRNNTLTNSLDSAAEAYKSKVPELSEDILAQIESGNFGKASRALAYQVVGNLPQQALTIGGAMLGTPAVGLAMSASVSASGEYDQAMDQGADPMRAINNAILSGSAEALGESLGTLPLLKKWGATVGARYGKDTWARIMKDVAKTIVISGAQEGAEEAATSAMQDLSAVTTGVNPDLTIREAGRNMVNSALVGMGSGVAVTSPAGAAMGVARRHDMNMAQQTADFLQAIGDKTKDLKLRKRLPEAAQQMVEQLTKDGPVENVYIKPEDFKSYFQSKNLDPLEAATLFGVAKEFQESQETGTDIRVPLSKFVSNLVDTEHYQGLKNSVKFNPESLSLNEAKAEEKKLKADLKLVAQDAEKDTETVPTPIQEAREVKFIVKERLLAMNNPLIDSNVAEQNALLHAQSMLSLSSRSGLSPMELLNRYGLKIQTQDGVIDIPGQDVAMASQGQVLNQEALAINPIDGTESLVSPLGFISPMQSAVSQMDFKEMPAKDLANRIKNLPGIKSEELELTGILDFLSSKDGKVSRAEVEQYLKDNSLTINQVVLSSDFKGSSDSEDGAVETEWGEPERDHSYDSDDINSEMEYYGSEDYWDDERVAELRAELAPDYTDENGEIDEDGLSSAVESAKETRAEELATEAVEADDYSNARYTVTDEATGWTLTGSDEFGWYSSEANENFETDLEEAKVRLIGHMIRQGALQGSTADYIKPKDVKWERVYTAETPNASVVTRKTNALFKKDRERLLAKAREENKWMLEPDSTYTKEEFEQEVEKDALKEARNEVVESYKDPTNKKNKISVDVEHDLINATLLGNDVDGYSFTVYGESVGRNRRSGEAAPRPILHETKFEGVTLDGAKEAAIKFLLERRVITPEGDRTTLDQQNTPVGRTKFGRYVEPGGENYREILLTIPNEGQEKFYYRNHFDQPNILVHIRVTDRIDDKGRKVLVADEIQSDWHQQGREKGYKGDFGEKESERLNDLISEINKARDVWESETAAKTLPLRNELKEIEALGPPNELARWLQTSSGKWAWFVGDKQVSGAFQEKSDKDAAESSIKLPETAKRWNRRFQLLREIEEIEGRFDSFGSVAKHLSENGYISKEMFQEYDLLNRAQESVADAVPDAPFKNTDAWAGLALKRLIRMGIEQGYDAVAWMPAKTHIDRWGTDNITWVKTEDGAFRVGSVEQRGGVADGTNIEELARVRGELLERRGETVKSKEELSKVIADTLGRERNDRSLESLTETVWKEMQEKPTGEKNPRAEGMSFFYDKVVPKTAQAIIKKLDPAAKIEVAKFDIGNDLGSYEFEGPDQSVEQLRLVLDNNALSERLDRQLRKVIQEVEEGNSFKTAIEGNGSPELAEIFGGTLKTPKKTIDALEIPITDAMKAKSEQGISLFQSAVGMSEARAQKKLTDILSKPDAVKKYSEIPGTFDGRLIDTDIVRTMLPEYTASVEASSAYNSATHKPASAFAWKMYVEKLKSADTRPVLLSGGGPASGKSAGVSLLPNEVIDGASVIFDGTLSVEEDAVERVEMALDSGRAVSIAFTYSPLEKAAERAIERFNRTGRLVPSDVMVKAHIGAIESILALSERYKGDPRVGFYVIDNTADFSQKIISIEELQALRYIQGNETVNEAAQRLTPTIAEKLSEVEREVQRRKDQEFSGISRANEGSNPEESGFSQQAADALDPRGRIVISSDKRMRIDLFAKADLSTFLHETGHFYLEIIDDLVKDPRTSQSLKDDYEKIRAWLGAKPGEKLTVEQHEQWARGFELYLAKGQAPTNELKRAFAHFRVWLTRIYKNLKELNVELTPEIVGVMDRLVATDEQLAAAVRDQQPLFENPLEAGMNEAQSEKYKKLDNDRKREASEELTREAIKAEMQKREAAYKAVRKEVRERIEKEANEMRVYRALSILQKGKMPDGSALPEGTQKVKLDRQSIVSAYGKEFLEKLPRPFVYSRDGGVDFNIAAEMLGYESGDALLTAIAGMPSKDEYVERETEREMALRFPDEVMQEFPEAAVRAAHNESRGKMIYFELETLAKDNLPLLKDAIKRVARRVPTEKEVRDHARTIIAKKNRAEVRPVIYERAERKAAKEAGELLAKGDIYGAFEAKRRELLNFELYRAAVEATETYEKALEFFKKYNGKDEDLAKTRDMDIVNVGRAILAQHGLGRSEKTPEQFLEQMKRYNPENYDSAISLIQNSGLMPGPYKEISFDEFSNMYETVRALWSLAKNARSVEIDGVRMDRDQIIDELAMRVDEVSKPGQRYGYDKAVTDWEKAKMKLMGARASLRRVESWVSAIDGESRGVFRKYIWNPIVESTARYRTAKIEVLTKYQDLLKNWAKTSDVSQTPIRAENLGYTFAGKVELMGAILHTGNKSNLEKLLIGRGWGTRLEDGTLDTNQWDAFMLKMYRDGVITKADMDFAQSVWDLMETLKPGAQKAHKAMYGFYFNEVTADAIETPFGSYRGGYVPAITDSVMVEDNAINQEKESLKQNNSSMYPTAGRGFTKSRVEQYAAPLAMDLRLVGSHIDKVLRFIHIEPSVKEVARVVMNKGFRAKLAELDPVIGQDMLVPWLQRAAQQTVSTPSKGWAGKAIDTFAKEMRKRAGLQAMFFNITNTMQQVTGFTIAAVRVKPKYLRNAMYRYLKSPKEMAEAVTSRSEFMKTRSDSQVMEVNKIIDELALQPTKFQEYRDFVQQHGYFMQSAAQGFVDHIVWSGAYEEAIADGQTEKEAARIADSAVRETQGSMNPEDMSRFESGSPLVRMFTMFYSYFNMQANLMGTEFVRTTRDMGLRKGAGRMLYVYTMGFMLPAWISTLIVQAMGNGIDEDDDDQYLDDLLGSFFTSQFSTATAMFPIVGPIINRVALSFNSKPFDDRITLSPAISMIESAGGAPQSVYKAIAEDGSKKKAVRDVMSAIGLLSGIPTGPVQRPLSYLVDVSEGDADPEGPIDFTRGLVTGKPGQVQ